MGAKYGGVQHFYEPKKALLDSVQKTWHAGYMVQEREVEDLLRAASLRVTRPRVAVLDAVRQNPHADAESIINVVREELGGVSKQAVYDVLSALVQAELVHKIEPQGSPARFETRVGDNHHHVVCRNCGAIADVDCAVGEAPCLHASNDNGFEIDVAEVIYWGTCPDCIAKAREEISARN